MKSFSLETLPKDGIERQEVLEPETLEHPSIFVRKKKEKEYFEARFALELAGVTRNRTNTEATGMQTEINKPDTTRYRKSLITGLSPNQGLQFIYSGGKDAHGNTCFDWKVVGLSRGLSFEDATASAKHLFQNLNVTLKAVRNDYSFAPVISGELGNEETDDVWIGTIRPLGIEISASDFLPVGFTNDTIVRENRRIIVAPHDDERAAETFDAVAAGAFGCPSNVRLMLSVSSFILSENDIQNIASALKWLKTREVKQIKFHDFAEEGVEDEELFKRLKNNLELWMKNPLGYRIHCNVTSLEPIPGSYLSLIGRDLFNCPASITMRKRAGQNEERADRSVLDLRDCINSDSPMPPLFPGINTLMDCGTKRVYMQPAINLSETGIMMGQTNDNRDVRFARDDRSRHCYIIGATGTGKSTLLCTMILQDIKNGEGIALIDPHGDLYHQVLRSVPKSRMDDIVLIDPCDFDYAVGINFLECNGLYKQIQMNFIVNEMIKIFDRLYDMRVAGGPIFEQYMRNALLLIMDHEVHEPSLMDIPMVFEEKEFRSYLLDKCKNPIVEQFWTKQAEKADGDASLRNLAPYITSKLNQFTTNALLRPIIGQPKSTINFREIMDSGKILLVNLSKGLLGELDTQLLGMLIIGKIFTAAMGRIAQRQEKRRPLFLYVDEFQNFTTDTVAYLLSEARKFGLYLTLANQNLAQLSANTGRQNILDAVLGNVGTMLLFRLGAVDAGKMEIYTKPELQAEDLQELPDFHAAGRLLINNTPSKPFVFKTLPPLEIKDGIDINLALNVSRKKYSTPTKQVEEAIINRRFSYKFNNT